jgi:outer membrane protein TolC
MSIAARLAGWWCLGLFCVPLRGEPVAWQLSVEDAVEMALSESHDIRIAMSQARETATQVSVARADALPNVSLQFSYSRLISPDSFQLPPGLDLGNLPFGRENTYNTALGIVQPLYRPGVLRGIRIAREYFRIAQDQTAETQLTTVLNVCLTYYDAVLAHQLAEIAQAQLDQFESELKEIRLRREAGEASDLDVSRAEVNRANVEPQLVDALNTRDSAMLRLRQLINLDAEADLVLTDELNTDGFKPIEDTELGDLTSASLQHRAAVRVAQRQVHIRREEVKQARAAYLPSLDAVGSFGYQAYPADTIPDADEWQKNWTAGLQLSIPIFEGGRRRAGVIAAKERVEQAALQLDQLVRAIRIEVERWRIQLKRAEALIVTRAHASDQAVRVYELTGLSYRNGSATYLELTDARTNLRSARANEVLTLHDYVAAYLNLIRAVGVAPEAFAHVQDLESHKVQPAPADALTPAERENR